MTADLALPTDQRESIARLAQALQALPDAYDLPVEHVLADGLYGRMCYMKAGACVVSRIHLQQHITVALTGRCTVVAADGSEREIVAPDVWVTEPGTQRALLIHEDAIWLTVHAAEVDDPEAMKERLTCATFADYETRRALPAPEAA